MCELSLPLVPTQYVKMTRLSPNFYVKVWLHKTTLSSPWQKSHDKRVPAAVGTNQTNPVVSPFHHRSLPGHSQFSRRGWTRLTFAH